MNDDNRKLAYSLCKMPYTQHEHQQRRYETVLPNEK